MKRFLLYFVAGIGLVLIAAVFHAEVYALLIVIGLATIKLVKGLFSFDIARLKAALLVILIYALIAVLYGCIYYLLPAKNITPKFERSMTGVWDAIYFSFVTVTTLGYGDFQPDSTIARAIVVSQLLVGILIIAVGINYIIGKRREGAQKITKTVDEK